jgi:hypothetical protein
MHQSATSGPLPSLFRNMSSSTPVGSTREGAIIRDLELAEQQAAASFKPTLRALGSSNRAKAWSQQPIQSCPFADSALRD